MLNIFEKLSEKQDETSTEYQSLVTALANGRETELKLLPDGSEVQVAFSTEYVSGVLGSLGKTEADLKRDVRELIAKLRPGWKKLAATLPKIEADTDALDAEEREVAKAWAVHHGTHGKIVGAFYTRRLALTEQSKAARAAETSLKKADAMAKAE